MNSSNTNGRVNIMNNAVFMLSDNIPVNDNSNFREALTGNWSNTPLSNIFFSNKNINILKNGIRYGVYEKSNNQFIIDKQNTDELKIIMRSTYLQNSKNLPTNITEQILNLNKKVLDYSIDQVYKEAESYMKFKNDVSTLALPIELPNLTKDNKQLEYQRFF